MSEQLFVPIQAITKTSEVRSLLDQIEKQYITVGEKLSNLLARKAADEGRTLTKRDLMDAQRGYVWESWRASLFIFTVMMQEPVNNVLLYRSDSTSQFKKVLDGQQRLTTLWMFVNNKFRLNMSKADFNTFTVGNEKH
jgi:hypothetical protein